jgi:hypothetical protein
MKSKEVKTGCNLAESSKEGYGSKRAVLLMIIMLIIRSEKNYNPSFNMTCCNVMFITSLYYCRSLERSHDTERQRYFLDWLHLPFIL